MASLKHALAVPSPLAKSMAEQFGMKVIITVIDIGAPNEDSPIYDELVKNPPTVDEPVQSSVGYLSIDEFVAGMDRVTKRIEKYFGIGEVSDTDR